MSLSVSSFNPTSPYQPVAQAETANTPVQDQVRAANDPSQMAENQAQDRSRTSVDPFIGSGFDVTA